MGRWAEKYTQEQRQAVGAAMLDPHPISGKMATAKEAVKLLNEGRLGVPPPAEPMPHTTAYDCRNKEKARRAGHQLSPLAKRAMETPDEARADLIQRAVSLHEQQLAKLEAQQAKDKLDPRLYSTFVKNTPTILALLKQPTPKGKTVSKERGHDDTKQPDATTELLAAHKATTGKHRGEFVTVVSRQDDRVAGPQHDKAPTPTQDVQGPSSARSANGAGADSRGDREESDHAAAQHLALTGSPLLAQLDTSE